MRKQLILLALSPLCISLSAQERPQVYMVANAHMDTQWRWNIQQTIGEFIPNTLYQNFALFEQYPDYIFNFEGGDKYAFVKEYYPREFEILRKYVKEGRWHVGGSSWDANDHNMPSVESCIRNYLYGQEFYKKEFGLKSTDVMLPDCFGFGYTIPSIAAHCGLIGFGTQKLQWRARPFYENGQKIPFRFGIWEGIDGSRIMAAFDGADYFWCPDSDVSDLDELKRFISENNKYGVNAAYRYFGTRSSRLHGDQGGSPTPLAVDLIDAASRNPKDYQVRFATTDQMYKDYYMKEGLPVFKGELLMDIHATGCYTSHTEMKRINRINEWLLSSAEAAGVMADWLGAMSYPSYTIDESWKRLIMHQFHDDLTGTSEPSVYQFSYSDEFLVENQMEGTIAAEIAALSEGLDTRVKGIPVVVFNPVSATNNDYVRMTVPLDDKYRSVEVYSPSGKKVPSQILSHKDGQAEILFAASSPSLSVDVYDVRPSVSAPKKSSSKNVSTIENKIYRLEVNSDGDISSIIDKRNGRQLVKDGQAISLQLFEDNWSDNWPAWEIFKFVLDREPKTVKDGVSIELEENGPVRQVLKVSRRYGESQFVQRIILSNGASDDRIDIVCDFDWRQRESLLKAAFPLNINAPEASYDLGMANVKRGVSTETAYEVYAHQWADMSDEDGSYGVTIMNDSKYGWDHPDPSTLRLTLLHTPLIDKAYDKYQRTMDIGKHSFTYSIQGHIGALKPSVASVVSDGLNAPKKTFVVSSHAGGLGKSFSMVKSSSPDLRIKAFKKAQDGDGYILRLYEVSGNGASGTIDFPVPVASAAELNGIEEKIADASFSGKSLKVNADPFRLKTYRIRLAAPAVKVPSPSFERIDLPFDDLVLTSDAFSAFGHMDNDWHSYACELIPEDLSFAGIPFGRGKADFKNGLRCKGQKIALPASEGTLYLLAASSDKDRKATFNAGTDSPMEIGYYSGLFGCYGWEGFYESFRRGGKVAYIGTHRHDSRTRNEIFVPTYMYLVQIPVSGGVLTLPEDENIVLFAATMARK